MQRIGKWIIGLYLVTGAPFSQGFDLAQASQSAGVAGIQFQAHLDRNTISLDDSVTLTISIQSEASKIFREPSLQAPDFEILGTSSSTSIGSQYNPVTGQFKTTVNKKIKLSLHPKKSGKLRISQIQMDFGGSVLRAPDLLVEVSTNPSQSSTQASPGRDRHSTQARTVVPGNRIYVKADVSQSTVYKGQKLIVSYSIYHQPRVLSAQIDKFPSMSGFLREDLIPLAMGKPVEPEAVEVQGVRMYRSLVAQYAAYPLQEGSLVIDPMAVRYSYQARVDQEPDDEMDPFMGFFRQVVPQVAVGQSEPVTIQVLPLPPQGRPSHFSGGVGRFELVSVVDKYQVKVNEPVSMTLKIEGDGNLASLQAPQATWPTSLELYDTQGRTVSHQGSASARVFEYLLIPKQSGQLILPALELSFFDPVQKVYYSKSTQPIEITVLEGASGTSLSSSLPSTTAQKKDLNTNVPSGEPRGLKVSDESHSLAQRDLIQKWQILFGAILCFGSILFFWITKDWLQRRGLQSLHRKSSRASSDQKKWVELRGLAQSSGTAWQSLIQGFDQLSQLILDAIDQAYGVSSRAVGRIELRELLVDSQKMSPELWERMNQILSYADRVRFAGSAGGVAETEVRNQFLRKVDEAEGLVKEVLASADR